MCLPSKYKQIKHGLYTMFIVESSRDQMGFLLAGIKRVNTSGVKAKRKGFPFLEFKVPSLGELLKKPAVTAVIL
jgi:hypothetical protein